MNHTREFQIVRQLLHQLQPRKFCGSSLARVCSLSNPIQYPHSADLLYACGSGSFIWKTLINYRCYKFTYYLHNYVFYYNHFYAFLGSVRKTISCLRFVVICRLYVTLAHVGVVSLWQNKFQNLILNDSGI